MNNLLGQSWCGMALCGVVRRCSVWFGLARQGKASTVARRGTALSGSLRRGAVWQGMVQSD
jgi:hypothetical protein